MGETDMFKTSLRGYDKDEVNEYVRRLRDEAASMQNSLRKEHELKDKRIDELAKRLDVKEDRQQRLEQEIHEKYQKYIDNYESISRLVYEAQIRAEELIRKAEEQREIILRDAGIEAKKRVDGVQSEIDARLSAGKKKHAAIQEELNEMVALINQVQKCFMSSYKEVHRLIKTMPSSVNEGNNGIRNKSAKLTKKRAITAEDIQERKIIEALEKLDEIEEISKT